MTETTIIATISILLIIIMAFTASATVLCDAYEHGISAGFIIPLMILLWIFVGFCVLRISEGAKTKSAADTTIETILNQNYYGYTNYHDDNKDKSFVYNGKKYNIDYDYTTNTLVIFEADGVSVDATYVNGQKQVINENN